ncbi:MAG: biotin/lipoyl-containing protein, partial [Lysobacter sp.]
MTIDIKVPDIGGYDAVPVIELLVAVGDTVAKDQGLVTLESDKATMEVPSPAAGVIKELKVKVGDKLAEGAVIAVLEAADADSVPADKPAPDTAASESKPSTAPPAAASEKPAEAKPAEAKPAEAKPAEAKPAEAKPAEAKPAEAKPAAPATGRKADVECRMLVLGAGPGGYTAAFRAADLGLDTVLVERYPSLGGVCLNVGCIPSKALLHAAAVIDEAAHASDYGIDFGKPKISLDALRGFKDKVVGQLTKGLTGMTKQRKVRVVTGVGMFVSPNEVEVESD